MVARFTLGRAELASCPFNSFRGGSKVGTWDDAVRVERMAGLFSTAGRGSSSIGLYLSPYTCAVLERDRGSRRLSPLSAPVFL